MYFHSSLILQQKICKFSTAFSKAFLGKILSKFRFFVIIGIQSVPLSTALQSFALLIPTKANIIKNIITIFFIIIFKIKTLYLLLL